MSKNIVSLVIAILFGLVGWVLYATESNKLNELESHVRSLDAKLLDADLVQSETIREWESDKVQLTDLQTNLTSAQEAIGVLEASSRKLESGLLEANKFAESVVQEKLKLEGDTKQYVTRIGSLESTRQAQERELADSSAAMAQTKKDYDAIEKRVVEATSAEQNVRNEYAGLVKRTQKQKEDMEAVNADLTSRIEILSAEVKKQSDLNEQIEADLAARDDSLKAAKDNLLQSSEQLDAVIVERKRLENSLNQSRERAQRVDELESQLARMDQESIDREALETQLDEARDRAEQVGLLETRLAQADEEIRQRTASLEETGQRVAGMEEQLELLKQRREDLVQKLQASDSLVSELKQHRDDLVQKLQAADALVSKLNQERDEARRKVDSLRAEIEKVAEKKELEVRDIREKVTLIRMDSDILYATGAVRLSGAGRDALKLVAAYAESVPDRVVSLEGHTDSVPISRERLGQFPSNWELSAARAGSAARYLQSLGITPERLKIVGYGQYRPVADNDSEFGRNDNRRLEIVLAPAQQFEKQVQVAQ